MYDRLRLYFDQILYADSCTPSWAKEHLEFFRAMEQRLRAFGLDDLTGLRVLDQGCGKLYWLTLLLHASKAEVTGVDVEFVGTGRSPIKYARILGANGWERAAKTLYWDWLYRGEYYQALEEAFGRELPRRNLELRCSSAAALDYSDETFDLIVSHEVWEHLPDLPAVVRETQRIMKPGALTYIYVHNYTSVSGGHHIAWKYPDEKPSKTVPPWDHLRDNQFPEIPSWINRQGESIYRDLFEDHFDVLAWDTTEVEGSSLLTAEIQRELQDYSEEELLKKGFVIVARKR